MADSTSGHEDEVVTVAGAKAAFQKFKDDYVDTLTGPTYDESTRTVTFPTTANVTYDSSTRTATFG